MSYHLWLSPLSVCADGMAWELARRWEDARAKAGRNVGLTNNVGESGSLQMVSLFWIVLKSSWKEITVFLVLPDFEKQWPRKAP